MLIFSPNADVFKQNYDRRLPAVAEEIKQKTQAHIRAGFDSAMVDSSAQAYIDYAEANGFTDLAKEMKRDLEFERSNRHE